MKLYLSSGSSNCNIADAVITIIRSISPSTFRASLSFLITMRSSLCITMIMMFALLALCSMSRSVSCPLKVKMIYGSGTILIDLCSCVAASASTCFCSPGILFFVRVLRLFLGFSMPSDATHGS